MGIADQVIRTVEQPAASELDEIELMIAKVRAGELAEEPAFEAIGRIVRRRTAAAQTYQKPWG